MSKRFYVLYTLKEFMIPRIYKTKATVTRYLEENKKLEYKQFSDEQQAQIFSRTIEQKMQKKFKLRMGDYLQKNHKQIEQINDNGFSRVKNNNQDAKKDSKKKEKELESQSQDSQRRKNKIENAGGKKDKKKKAPQYKEKRKTQQEEEQNSEKKQVKQEQVKDKKKSINIIEVRTFKQEQLPTQTIENIKQKTLISIQPKEAPQITYEHKEAPQITYEHKEAPQIAPVQKTSASILPEETFPNRELKFQIQQISPSSLNPQTNFILQEISLTSSQKVSKDPIKQLSQTNSNLNYHPLNKELLIVDSNISRFFLHPLLNKLPRYLFPYFNLPFIRANFNQNILLNNPFVQQKQASINFSLELVIRQNMGYSLALLNLQSSKMQGCLHKAVHLNVKNRQQAQVQAILNTVNLLSSFDPSKKIVIKTNFIQGNLPKYQKSLNPNVRKSFGQFQSQLSKFTNVDYL